MKTFSQSLLVLIFLLAVNWLWAQPEITLWRITDPEGHQHENGEHQDKGAELYVCGTQYYLKHSEGETNFIFDIRNDGDQNLVMELPIRLTAGSSSLFEVTAQPSATLVPGEESKLMITYTGPSEYLPAQAASIQIFSNAWTNPTCGFNVQVGTLPTDEYCVCTESGPETIDLGGLPGFITEQDEILIADQSCESLPQPVECPVSDEVACYIQRNIWITGFEILRSKLKSDFNPMEDIFLQDGYCPCEPELDPEACMETPFDESNPELQREQIATRDNHRPCPGESFVVDTSKMCGLIIPPALNRSIQTRGVDYTFEWDVLGFGTATPFPMGDSATISNWQNGDQLVLKITDGDGCLSVTSMTLFANNGGPEFIQFFVPPQGCGPNEFVLCADYSGSVTLHDRESVATRSDIISFTTNGGGVLTPLTDGPGDCCVTVSGASIGDRIVATHNTDVGVNGCPISSYVFVNDLPTNCEFFVSENLIFIPNIMLDDPCSCTDPLNYTGAGDVTFFHDFMVIENPGNNGFSANITNRVGWFDDMEVEQNADFMAVDGGALDDDGMANGVIILNFYHPAGAATTADVTVAGVVFPFVSMICNECPDVPIPTMGQWGIMILGLLALIFGIASIKEKRNIALKA